HFRAGKFWLFNRLPDQWRDEAGHLVERSRREHAAVEVPALVRGPATANPAHKFRSSRPEEPSTEDDTQNIEATSPGCVTLRAAWLGPRAGPPAHILVEAANTWNRRCLTQPRCHPERSEGPFLWPKSPLASLGVTTGLHQAFVIPAASDPPVSLVGSPIS